MTDAEHTTTPPTPGTVNKDVPTEAWRASLTATADAPAADRHARISDLLDDLEGQVGSL